MQLSNLLLVPVTAPVKNRPAQKKEALIYPATKDSYSYMSPMSPHTSLHFGLQNRTHIPSQQRIDLNQIRTKLSERQALLPEECNELTTAIFSNNEHMQSKGTKLLGDAIQARYIRSLTQEQKNRLIILLDSVNPIVANTAIKTVGQAIEKGLITSRQDGDLLSELIASLSEALGSSDSFARNSAIKTMGQAIKTGLITSLSDVVKASLFKALGSSDPVAQSSAIKTVGQAIENGLITRQDRDLLNRLKASVIKALGSSDPVAQSSAIKTLGQAIEKGLITSLSHRVKASLIKALGSSDPVAQSSAIKTVGQAIEKGVITSQDVDLLNGLKASLLKALASSDPVAQSSASVTQKQARTLLQP